MSLWRCSGAGNRAGGGASRRVWLTLTETSALASVAVLPYLLELQRDALAQANARRVADGKRPITTGTLAALTVVQSHFVFGTVSALGLRFAQRMGLGAPHLEVLLHGRRPVLASQAVIGYVTVGAATALLLAGLDRTLFAGARAKLERTGAHQPSVWRALLAVPYGAVAEEVLARLGLQTLFAAGLRQVRAESRVPPSPATMWPAILLSGLAFGAGHLPATAGLARLSAPLVARALLLNGVAGAVFGYLYWREGLEAAMIAHGSADLVLHAGLPLAGMPRPG